MKKLLFISILIFLFCSCGNTPYQKYYYDKNPVYSWGYQMFYGDYYADKGVSHNIATICLFSDTTKLFYDGYGQLLELYDVVLPSTDTLLAVGTYTADTTFNTFTFAKGKIIKENNKEYSTGSYINYYEIDNSRTKGKLIESGTFTVSISEEKYTIVCDFVTDDGEELKGNFNGYKLPAYDLSFQERLQGIPRPSFFILE